MVRSFTYDVMSKHAMYILSTSRRILTKDDNVDDYSSKWWPGADRRVTAQKYSAGTPGLETKATQRLISTPPKSRDTKWANGTNELSSVNIEQCECRSRTDCSLGEVTGMRTATPARLVEDSENRVWNARGDRGNGTAPARQRPTTTCPPWSVELSRQQLRHRNHDCKINI